MDESRVVVAELLRPRGNRGEVLARSQTDSPGRLESLKEAQVRFADGSDAAVRIEQVWAHATDWVFKFAGVDSIDSADRFRDADLWVEREQRAELPPGEFFQSDLIGCRLVDAKSGTEIGVVDGWQQYGGPPLMEVVGSDREWLIPFVPAYCRSVDVNAKRMLVELPDGLLDL